MNKLETNLKQLLIITFIGNNINIMKNLSLTILLLITSSLFSQGKDKKSLIDEMNNYYNKAKIEKLDILTTEILSGKYGSMDDELKFYALMYSTNVYTSDEYSKKDAQKGYDKTIELLELLKITSYNVPNKEAYLKSLTEFIPNYLKKHPNVQTEITKKENSNTQNSTSITSNEENKTPSSDNKTVSLTVSGTGKTIEEARLNALRSAIEQAFGTFISSKTEILNDNLVKDEIVSISNGNIQKYDIVSQVEIPDNGYSITLNATVSIENLISYAESKGISIEFKGGMFAQNIKLQKLNEKSEIIAIKNLCQKSFELLLNSLDFSIEAGEPQSLFGNKEKNKIYNYKYDIKNGCYVKQFEEKDYFIDFTINVKSNNNLKLFYDNFIKTIISLSMSPSEINNYKSINKPHFAIRINEKDYYLRNPESINIFRVFFTKMQLIPSFFEINSNVETFNNLLVNKWLKPMHNKNSFLNFYERYYDNYYDYFRTDDYSIESMKVSTMNNIFPIFNDIFNFDYQFEFEKDNEYKYRKGLDRFFDLKSFFEIVPNEFESKFSLSRSFTIEEIEKLNVFEIKKIDLLTTLKKEQDRINNVKNIILFNYGYRGYVPENFILELNDKKYECKNYCEYPIEPASDGYIFELIEKKSDFYIVKSINPYTNEPGKLYKLKPSKEVIKKEY